MPLPPQISVIIFVLNAVDTIERTLISVIEQLVPRLELIILDAGSTDGTVEIIRRYQEHITWWRSAPDEGPTAAINEGITLSSGEVICLLPADDWLEPGALHAVIHEFDADPELDLLSCGARFVRFDVNGEMKVDALFNTKKILDFTMANIVHYPLSANRFIRRRIYKQFGGHDVSYRIGGDSDFLIRICAFGVHSKVIERLTYSYLRHEKSTTLSGNPEIIFLMMMANIRVAESALALNNISEKNRSALVGMHGRCSTRLAWMLLKKRLHVKVVDVLLRAWKINFFWPLFVPLWFIDGWYQRNQLSNAARRMSTLPDCTNAIPPERSL